MKKQQGAALIIVLALLAGSLMLGLSGMNSALIDERLAGNYRAASLAQMAAEDMAGYIRKNYEYLEIDDDIERKDENDWNIIKMEEVGFSENEDVTLQRSYSACHSTTSGTDACEQVYQWLTDKLLEVPFYIARGQVMEGNGGKIVAKHLVVVGKASPLTTPLLCVGSGCPDEMPGSLEGYFSDKEHPLPDDFICQGGGNSGNSKKSCRTNPNEDSDVKYYRKINSLGSWVGFVNGLADEVFEGNDLPEGERYQPEVFVIEGDENKVSSKVNTSGVIVIRDGATFEAGGGGTHEGLIIVAEGGHLSVKGTYSIYGSIVALGDLNGIDFSGGGGGDGVRYNTEALTGIPKGEVDYVWFSL
ncbi:hypothetical protein GPM19_12645 [Halomonas sp. ZH2S]|uniref:Type 4 fimbrial biogenesis protein PilX N-terminal domain-containing protein n=1 Tax=Vreelandella zhuhanensis TaxID=2684210 RepID=A0A7X3H1Y5_9GAMM|nr:hypothetical protein [Halomonas zhuhanensis]MWJ29036.1 hypothetical protein [Halomonas zhuhanensis]